jgi:hypothetical protein
LHSGKSRSSVNFPGPQPMHVIFWGSLYFPGSQPSHSDMPGARAFLHGKQPIPFPGVGIYVVGVQRRQRSKLSCLVSSFIRAPPVLRYLPAAQAVQFCERVTFVYQPLGHTWHCVRSEPRLSLYLPFGQNRQFTLLACWVYAPLGHASQKPDPVEFAFQPAGHDVHSVSTNLLSFTYVPVGQE